MPAPSWGKPLRFPIVIADRRNNRQIEVTPDKRIVWVFDSPNLKVYRGNEDVNFAADGKVMTADIRNCRILFVDRETLKIGTQWGKPGQCKHDPPNLLAFPNGATPLANGDILVSEISGSWISRITREGKVLWSVQAPKVRYPSDAFPTWDDLRHRVIVIDRETKAIVWQYGVTDKAGNAAGELHYPNGFDIDVFRDWKPAVAPKRP